MFVCGRREVMDIRAKNNPTQFGGNNFSNLEKRFDVDVDAGIVTEIFRFVL